MQQFMEMNLVDINGSAKAREPHGLLIGLGGTALAFIANGLQLLFFSPKFVLAILTPLLLAMTLAFIYGFITGKKGWASTK